MAHFKTNLNCSVEGFLEFADKMENKPQCNTYFSAATSSDNFTNILPKAFTLVDPESVKNTFKSSVTFYAFRICERKS